MKNYAQITELHGKTITNVEVLENSDGDMVRFTCSDGSEFEMYHTQDCCESVYLEGHNGLTDLIGQRIIYAYESSNSEERGNWGESVTWTFYTIQGDKTAANMRWYGSSNGYYSEDVNFYCTKQASVTKTEKPSRYNLED